MGYDLGGLRPSCKTGVYFRNNIWWWHQLAGYVQSMCADCMTKKELNGYWHSNDGQIISARSTVKIAAKLKKLIASGKVKQHQLAYYKKLRKLPKERCRYCEGTGKRATGVSRRKVTCTECKGKGKVSPLAMSYPFTEQNVREFMKFCAGSGGFRIC